MYFLIYFLHMVLGQWSYRRPSCCRYIRSCGDITNVNIDNVDNDGLQASFKCLNDLCIAQLCAEWSVNKI